MSGGSGWGEGPVVLEIAEGDDAVEVRSGGAPICRYVFGPELFRPYVSSLRLPGGPELLADAPADHHHHHGLWFGHGRIEAADGSRHDLWLERPGCGRLAHSGLVLTPDGFEATAEWRAGDGRVLARDRRVFAFAVAPDRVVVSIAYSLVGDGLRLHGTNESGLPHIRPAPWIAVAGGGRSVDAQGRVGEAAILGQPAAWVDCSGTWEGRVQGLCLEPANENLGRAPRWFVRDYGPFSANDAFFGGPPVEPPLGHRFTVTLHTGPWRP